MHHYQHINATCLRLLSKCFQLDMLRTSFVSMCPELRLSDALWLKGKEDRINYDWGQREELDMTTKVCLCLGSDVTIHSWVKHFVTFPVHLRFLLSPSLIPWVSPPSISMFKFWKKSSHLLHVPLSPWLPGPEWSLWRQRQNSNQGQLQSQRLEKW